MATESKQGLVVQDVQRKISRRDCLTGMAALGLSASAMSALLTACDSGMGLSGASSSSEKITLSYGYFGNPAELKIYLLGSFI